MKEADSLELLDCTTTEVEGREVRQTLGFLPHVQLGATQSRDWGRGRLEAKEMLPPEIR